MRITEAARVLGTSPRMLRYRESLGLLPAVQHRRSPDDSRPDDSRPDDSRPDDSRPDDSRPDDSRPDDSRRGQSGRGHPGHVQPGHVQPGHVQPGHVQPGHVQPGHGRPRQAANGGHRQFTEADLAAVALGLSVERRYDISPAELAFGIRVLADPRLRSDVAELGRRIGRIQPPPARALDFEQERALRLLRLSPPAPPYGDNKRRRR
jgi:hypothetical protein